MAAAPFTIASRLSPAARLPVRAWRAARPAHGFASSGRARSLAVAPAAQENRDNSVDVQVSQNGGNRQQQGKAVQRRAAPLDISPFGKSSSVHDWFSYRGLHCKAEEAKHHVVTRA